MTQENESYVHKIDVDFIRTTGYIQSWYVSDLKRTTDPEAIEELWEDDHLDGLHGGEANFRPPSLIPIQGWREITDTADIVNLKLKLSDLFNDLSDIDVEQVEETTLYNYSPVAVYAYCNLRSDVDQFINMYLWHDGAAAVWVNGEQVYSANILEHTFDRAEDEDLTREFRRASYNKRIGKRLFLREGDNHCLVKIVNPNSSQEYPCKIAMKVVCAGKITGRVFFDTSGDATRQEKEFWIENLEVRLLGGEDRELYYAYRVQTVRSRPGLYRYPQLHAAPATKHLTSRNIHSIGVKPSKSDIFHGKDLPFPRLPFQPIETEETVEAIPITTNRNGVFEFTNLCPGDWYVQLHTEINDTGDLNIWAEDDNGAPVQPVDKDEYWPLPRLRLSNLEFSEIYVDLLSTRTADLGQIGYIAQGGFVVGTLFFDEDGTGSPEGNPRLADAIVELENLNSGKHLETRTDAQGTYYFADPEPGVYKINFPATAPAAAAGFEEGELRISVEDKDDLPSAFYLGFGQEETQDMSYILTGSSIQGIIYLDKDATGQRTGNEPGIPGVPIVLARNGGAVAETETLSNGEYWFEDILPGEYTLRFISTYAPGDYSDDITTSISDFKSRYGDEFILTDESLRKQKVVVNASERIVAEPTGYTPEVHEIRGRVVDEEGQGIPNVAVRATDEKGVLERTGVTDEEGYYKIEWRGPFKLEFPESPYKGQWLTPNTIKGEVHSIAEVPDAKYRRDDGGLGAGGDVQESLADIATYMPTSHGTGLPASRGSGYGVPDGLGALQHAVDGAMTTILGRRVQRDDVKGIRDSLTRAFTIEKVNGKRQVNWMPRVYIVQTELGGAITGAQASLYRRAKAALDDALPLLDALEPLTVSPDEEEVEAVRAIVRTEFTELVNELGLEGGPRSKRVDKIFAILHAQLDRLQSVFGLDREQIITVDEEQRLTDFLVIKDYVMGLRSTWENFRQEFQDTRFLGTQLVLLERALSSVGESVEETYRVMDSVSLGPNERQTVRIPFADSALFVEELLSWVSRFATVESQTLIQDGGRRGVETIEQIAVQLRDLVQDSTEAEVNHVGFNRTRVRRSLRELASQIDLVAQLAREL